MRGESKLEESLYDFRCMVLGVTILAADSAIGYSKTAEKIRRNNGYSLSHHLYDMLMLDVFVDAYKNFKKIKNTITDTSTMFMEDICKVIESV